MTASDTPARAKASYEVNTLGLHAGPLHVQLLAYYNDMHEAQAAGDTATISRLQQVVPPMLDDFEKTECKTTANPQWLATKMRAGWYVALGDFETALKFERAGYDHAEHERPGQDIKGRNQRRSISASNVADESWRMGRAAEGLPWALLSVDLWPENSVNHLVLAITAYHAGQKETADKILAELGAIADFTNRRDALAACLTYERELRHMRDLKSVQDLLAELGGK